MTIIKMPCKHNDVVIKLLTQNTYMSDRDKLAIIDICKDIITCGSLNDVVILLQALSSSTENNITFLKFLLENCTILDTTAQDAWNFVPKVISSCIPTYSDSSPHTLSILTYLVTKLKLNYDDLSLQNLCNILVLFYYDTDRLAFVKSNINILVNKITVYNLPSILMMFSKVKSRNLVLELLNGYHDRLKKYETTDYVSPPPTIEKKSLLSNILSVIKPSIIVPKQSAFNNYSELFIDITLLEKLFKLMCVPDEIFYDINKIITVSKNEINDFITNHTVNGKVKYEYDRDNTSQTKLSSMEAKLSSIYDIKSRSLNSLNSYVKMELVLEK
jgi:hypothetical protein